MNETEVIRHLENNRNVLIPLMRDFDEAGSRWKPSEEKWSGLEIVCHLIDEEIYDFRTRVKLLLESPNTAPPKINPQGWVKEHRYMDQSFSQKLREWDMERLVSVNWLKSLDSPIWTNSFVHPELGELSAGFFLNNWLAHDYLHIRQLTRLKYDYLEKSGNGPLQYAGKWI